MLGDDVEDDDDEGAGRPTDLETGAAERRYEEAGDDRRDNALVGCRTAGDCKCHRKRQRDDGDRQAGYEIAVGSRAVP